MAEQGWATSPLKLGPRMSNTFDPYRTWLGIPRSQQPPNHYALLGIGLYEDDPEVISNAADRQVAHVRSFHVGPHSELSQRLLNELAGARLCLLNPKRREQYNAELAARLPAAVPTQHDSGDVLNVAPFDRGVEGGLPSQATTPLRHVSGGVPSASRNSARAPILLEQPDQGPQPIWHSRLDDVPLEPASTRAQRGVILGAAAVMLGAVLFAMNLTWPQSNQSRADRGLGDRDLAAAREPSPGGPTLDEQPQGDEQPRQPTQNAPPPPQRAGPGESLPAKPPTETQRPEFPPRTWPPRNAPPSNEPPGKEPPSTEPQPDEPPPGEPKDSSPTKPSGQTASFDKIVLPSGAVLSKDEIQVTPNEIAQFKSSMGETPFRHLYPDGSLAGQYAWNEGKLHGWALTVYENQQPLLLAQYNESRREGPLRIWNEYGTISYFGEFKNGEPHGLKCLFEQGMPWLVEECNLGDLQARYRIDWREGTPTIVEIVGGGELTDPLTAAAVEALAALEENLALRERSIRVDFTKWYRKNRDALRAEIAARLHQVQRQNRAERKRLRDEENEKRNRALRDEWLRNNRQ